MSVVGTPFAFNSIDQESKIVARYNDTIDEWSSIDVEPSRHPQTS